jgi:hypothetical protein
MVFLNLLQKVDSKGGFEGRLLWMLNQNSSSDHEAPEGWTGRGIRGSRKYRRGEGDLHGRRACQTILVW